MPAGMAIAPAEQGIAHQVAAALSAVFGDVLSTFNLLFDRPVPVILGAMAIALLLLFLGWKIYRITLVMFGLLAGATLGFLFGDWISAKFAIQSAAIPVAITVVLALLLGILAVPFVKLMVFVFCGFLGSVSASYLCQRLGLGSSVLWTAASFVIVGLLSVLLMRHAMILFTSLLGSYVLVAGAMAMCHRFGGILIANRMNLVWPMIAWLVLFLLGVRAQAGRGSEKRHIS
ncbi:MAG TPA: hypothetical protein VM163_01150 [bacterium]|nr:hypothetical protein [bacterium]